MTFSSRLLLKFHIAVRPYVESGAVYALDVEVEVDVEEDVLVDVDVEVLVDVDEDVEVLVDVLVEERVFSVPK